MSTETLTPALLFGGLLALLLEFPGIRTWWEAQSSERKQKINLLVILIFSLAFSLIPSLVGEAPPLEGWDWLINPVATFLVALVSGAGTHAGTRLVYGTRNS